MKIKMLVGLSGLDFSLSPGDVTDRFDDKEARRLVKANYAEPVATAPERAVAKAPARRATANPVDQTD